MNNSNSTFRFYSKLVLIIGLFFQMNLSAQNPWNGQVTANYNVCDGSITFTSFVFEDCPSCTDWAVGNFVLQYRDELGVFRRLAVVRMLKAMTASGNRMSGEAMVEPSFRRPQSLIGMTLEH
jgi:hypothetical protein